MTDMDGSIGLTGMYGPQGDTSIGYPDDGNGYIYGEPGPSDPTESEDFTDHGDTQDPER